VLARRDRTGGDRGVEKSTPTLLPRRDRRLSLSHVSLLTLLPRRDLWVMMMMQFHDVGEVS
jgi:hypothetical protein